MGLLLGSLIAAGVAGLLGTGISHIERKTDRDYNAKQAEIQRDFEAAEAEKNRTFQAEQAQITRDYETQMSNTAVQRQVADMEAAGINSAMAYSSGASGASTPSVGTPSGATAHGSAASSASAHTNVGAVLSGAANMVHTFNYDGDKSNNIDLKQALGMISNVASIFK